MFTLHNYFFRGNGLKGRVVLNKNLAFLKFRLYEVITHTSSLDAIQEDDLNGKGNLSAQCTIRVTNIRNGIRRVTFRNDKDNKEQSMAVILVDIQVLTLEEINQRIAKCKRDIEVKLLICFFKLFDIYKGSYLQ